MSGIARIVIMSVFLLSINTGGKVYAQEATEELCGQINQEALCEEVPLLKGTPSLETVAGNEEIVAPPEVLGESTATLAKTGSNSFTVAIGLSLIAVVIVLKNRTEQKYSIRRKSFY